MAKGGGSVDDIVRQVMERLAKNAPKTAASTAKSGGRTAASVSAKAMTKAERSAANKAAHASRQGKLMAERAVEAPATKAARTAENRSKYIGKKMVEVNERWGGGSMKLDKAKSYFGQEAEKFNKVIDATDRILTKGSQGRRDSLTKQITKVKEYAKKEGYDLSVSDIAAITKDSLKSASRTNTRAKGNLKYLMEKYGTMNRKELVDTGARKAMAYEKRGKRLEGKKPDYMTANEKATQRRLANLEQRKQQERLIKKADSKMGSSTGARKKAYKPIKETESSMRLRAAQAKNAKKSVVDPKVAKMTDAQRKKLVSDTIKEKNRLKNVKVSGRGYTDAEAKAKLAALGEREMGGSNRLRAKNVKKKSSPEGLRKQFSKK